MIYCLSGERTVGRSCKYPPKEGNMMSDFLPPFANPSILPQPSEVGWGGGGGCLVCMWWSCRCWVKRVSNSNLHLHLEHLPLCCQSAVQSSLPLFWQQSRPSSCVGPGWRRQRRGWNSSQTWCYCRGPCLSWEAGFMQKWQWEFKASLSFYSDPKKPKQNPKQKKGGVKTIQVYSCCLISISQFCHLTFWPQEQWLAMISNSSKANAGLVFCFIRTPATGLYFVYVSMWQQWWQVDRTTPLCANKHPNSNHESPCTQAQSICLCLSGRWLQSTAAIPPPSPLPHWSLLSPFSLAERVVGLFGTAQPLCFLPGRPQEAGSAVILAVTSRGGKPYKAKTCSRSRRASVLTFIINTSCLYLTP